MKKLILTMGLFMGIVISTFAQTVFVTGAITDANGTPIPNYPVQIQGDSFYFSIVLTNTNGVYSDNVPMTNTQGMIDIMVIDSCTGIPQYQTLFYSPSQTSFTNVDFQICAAVSGCSAFYTYSSTMSGIVSFNAASTGVAPFAYSWSMGDGATYSSQSPIHSYANPGIYLACLTVTDQNGCVATYCDSVSVGGSTPCQAQVAVSSASGLTASFVPITSGVAPYSYQWNFGDGNTSTNTYPTHNYAQSGTYLVCLTITDASGCVATDCDTITLSGSAPCQTAFVMNSISGLTASFSSVSSGVAPFAYSWDFGDSSTSTSAHPTHTYAQSGVYVVCLTVTDATGCSMVYCLPVTVTNTTPPVGGNILGTVLYDTISGQQPLAKVSLIARDTVTNALTIVATDTTTNGAFHFGNLPLGSYHIHAELLPSDQYFNDYLPTYFMQSLHWHAADSLQLHPSNTFEFVFVDLINANSIASGAGSIGGATTNTNGASMAGMLVILFDANMNPIGYAITDANGNYSFPNLPDGVYYIYIEGLGMQAAPVQVTLSPTNRNISNVDFQLGNTYVVFTNTNTIDAISNIKTFPNPVTNELNIQMDVNQFMDIELSVLNLTGQVLMMDHRTINSGNNQFSVLTNQLPTGVYMLRMQSAEGVWTQKFIKK